MSQRVVTSVRRHATWWWAIVGVLLAIGMWFSWTAPGAVLMIAALALCFPLWHFTQGRRAWVGVLTMSIPMATVLTWAAATSQRCPKAGTTVLMQLGKAPVACEEFRAAYAGMAMFFATIAIIAAFAPSTIAKARAQAREDDSAATQ